jgi:hypothetical protein
MIKTFGMKKQKVILAAGTIWADHIQSSIYELDLTHPDLAQFVDL